MTTDFIIFRFIVTTDQHKAAEDSRKMKDADTTIETTKAMNGLQVSSNKSSDSHEASSQSLSNDRDPSKQTTKREDYLEWPDYFMAIAFLSAQRSKDPVTQVGACIVNPEKRIVGIGYNGMPMGCDDDEMPWGRHGENYADTKYAFGKYIRFDSSLVCMR